MKLHSRFPLAVPLKKLGLFLAFCCFTSVPVLSCTILVLSDGNRVLFFNNEDWVNPKTRIWFVPAACPVGGDGYYGCAYVGYDDGWARGGLNTEGLACDWVGGFNEKWDPDPRTCVRGNPTQRLLESCATVEEAIAFFRTHREPDFSRAKILVADRFGTSVIIGATDGKLKIEKANRNRGFGYGDRTLDEMLPTISGPTISNGVAILHACLQKSQYATKYTNVFDLKSGDIYLFQFHERDDSVKLNLATELKEGGHYYDMSQIRRQLTEAPLPLLINMRRFFMDEFPPISDTEPDVTKHIRSIMLDVIGGTMRPEDYTDELWQGISPAQKEIRTDLMRNGNFVSIALVERRNDGGRRSYRYRVEFEKATLLLRYVLDEQNKISLIQSDGGELKPGADLGE